MKRLYSLLYRLAVVCESETPADDAFYGVYSWDTRIALEDTLPFVRGREALLITEILKEI